MPTGPEISSAFFGKFVLKIQIFEFHLRVWIFTKAECSFFKEYYHNFRFLEISRKRLLR